MATMEYVLSTGEKYYSGKGVGGLWDEIGKLQFDFLVLKGLLPQHRLLDIGCGSLRGGVHFINYLDDGNYYGIEKQEWLLRAAREIELPRYRLDKKTIHLRHNGDFDLSLFGTSYDYALAQSVFTHLSWDSILKCLANVEKVLGPQGRLFATFFEDPDGGGKTRGISQAPGIVSYSDRDPYHYELTVFDRTAQKLGLAAEYVGEWGHPRNQKMLCFSRMVSSRQGAV